MRGLNKKKNHQREDHFHDEWAKSFSVDTINIATQFEGVTSPEYRKAIDFLGNVKHKKIINLGCGLGEESVYLATKGAKVFAIDISKEMLKTTKKLAKRYHVEKNISYYHMSAERLTFSKESFDAVLGCNILHHVNIAKTIREVKRVLKPKGVAVFCEPLTYNPIINIYRLMAHQVRTDDEHPLHYQDLKIIKESFPNFIHKEFQLFTLLIFIWFFLGERLHPNKVRYWKKIIIEAERYKTAFKLFYSMDRFVLHLFPFLQRYCWITVIRVQK